MNNNNKKKYDEWVFIQSQCVLTHLFKRLKDLHYIEYNSTAYEINIQTIPESFTQNLKSKEMPNTSIL